MRAAFVITEHPSALTTAQERHYERLRRQLAGVAEREVESVHYLDVRDLEGRPAVLLSGSFAPWAAHDEHALAHLGTSLRAYDGPVLGICAGMQLLAMFTGGSVGPASAKAETGFGPVDVLDDSDLLQGLDPRVDVYKHHNDEVSVLPQHFRILARSRESAVEAIAHENRPWWGTQFHPEEFDSSHPAGRRVLENFFKLGGLQSSRPA